MNTNMNMLAKEIWLTYFNNTLYKKGIINEKERNRMKYLISNYCHNKKV